MRHKLLVQNVILHLSTDKILVIVLTHDTRMEKIASFQRLFSRAKNRQCSAAFAHQAKRQGKKSEKDRRRTSERERERERSPWKCARSSSRCSEVTRSRDAYQIFLSTILHYRVSLRARAKGAAL